MKIRKGLVSNSSSSSFVCDVCGHSEGGWDRSAGELGFAVCVNGHTICIDHVLFDTEDVLSLQIASSSCAFACCYNI